jgi:hypothetical protein
LVNHDYFCVLGCTFLGLILHEQLSAFHLICPKSCLFEIQNPCCFYGARSMNQLAKKALQQHVRGMTLKSCISSISMSRTTTHNLPPKFAEQTSAPMPGVPPKLQCLRCTKPFCKVSWLHALKAFCHDSFTKENHMLFGFYHCLIWSTSIGTNLYAMLI